MKKQISTRTFFYLALVSFVVCLCLFGSFAAVSLNLLSAPKLTIDQMLVLHPLSGGINMTLLLMASFGGFALCGFFGLYIGVVFGWWLRKYKEVQHVH